MRLRHFTVYETAGSFYIVGSDASEKSYYLLKFDRTDPRMLMIGEPDHEYSKNDVMELLATISEGNSIVYKSNMEKRSSSTASKYGGLTERVSNAFGLAGAVRFLEGYYILLVTKARVVASFGYHSVYKIEEVSMICIAANGCPSSPDEQRYVKLFQSVDLTTDFYFSYTYDLSRTLQENATQTCGWPSACCKEPSSEKVPFVAEQKFIWNRFLLEPLRKSSVSERWMLELVHGYVGQQIIELPCSRLSLTLIGRRSSEYAGTRYLKRGANLRGHVANDVETEQILWDICSSPNFHCGKFSAFVQRRGSVPLLWSQDPATRGVVGKPLISIDINEPHAQTAAAHFRELRKKYGFPLIVMNLVKRREKSGHEAVLHNQFLKALKYLNQFVPMKERIAYLSFDVARCNKTGVVLNKLEEIGLRSVIRHGWFQSFPRLYCHIVRPNAILAEYEPRVHANGRFLLQSGISRTNCVDCLDRTNVAQFGIGKVALGLQLYAMGFVDEPILSLSSEVCRIYEDLMDEHGDKLALQYAGSQLVHSIKTYKKISAFQERSRDVIQTLSRYYSNTFGDYDKQNAINLFLGVYRPGSLPHLWDLATDYYLHFPIGYRNKSDYCAWYLEDARACSKHTEEESTINDSNPSDSQVSALLLCKQSDSSSDQFDEYYRVWELSSFDALVREQRDLQKSVAVNGVNQSVAQSYSFAKLWKTEASGKSKSASGKQKKAALADDDDEEDEPIVKSDAEVHYESEFSTITHGKHESRMKSDSRGREGTPAFINASEKKGLQTGLKSCAEVYGFELRVQSDADTQKYVKYASLGGCKPHIEDWHASKPKRLSDLRVPGIHDYSLLKPLSFYTADSTFQTELPEVSKASMKVYMEAGDGAVYNPKHPSSIDSACYGRYSQRLPHSAPNLAQLLAMKAS
uniref:Polyphosphoinositide phosphatase n=1 Tax=Ascaris suum TaxID=6253 RepID=F1KTV5_ASCSU